MLRDSGPSASFTPGRPKPKVTNQTDEFVIQLFHEQRSKLAEVRKLDYKHPDFKFWHDSTASLFQRFVRPDSPHFEHLREIRFLGPSSLTVRRVPYGYRGPLPRADAVRPEDKEQFEKGCSEADNCIQGAINEITLFGLHAEAAKVKPSARGGVQQNFHAPVTIANQIIATDNAIQNIGKVGGTGASLNEVAKLLNESLDLTGRQRLEALKCIELIASETAKPEEKRNWKSIAEWGGTLLDLVGKAADVGTKLAPYLPTVVALVEHANK